MLSHCNPCQDLQGHLKTMGPGHPCWRRVIEQLGVTEGLQDVERAAHQVCKTMGHCSDDGAHSARLSAHRRTFSCKAFRIPPHTMHLAREVCSLLPDILLGGHEMGKALSLKFTG